MEVDEEVPEDMVRTLLLKINLFNLHFPQFFIFLILNEIFNTATFTPLLGLILTYSFKNRPKKLSGFPSIDALLRRSKGLRFWSRDFPNMVVTLKS